MIISGSPTPEGIRYETYELDNTVQLDKLGIKYRLIIKIISYEY